MKGWKKIFQKNGPKKQAGIAILISDKINFKPKFVRTEKERHYELIKRKSHHKDIAILYNYAPNKRVPILTLTN